MAGLSGSAQEDALIHELLRVSDSEFSRTMSICRSGRAVENYGPHVARLLSPGLLAHVAQRREWDMTRDQPYDRSLMRDTINEPKTAREAELFERIQKLKSELNASEQKAVRHANANHQLREKFSAVFGEPVVVTKMEMAQVPLERAPDVRGWRVRVHVPAFTVEVTMQELVLAREHREKADGWIRDAGYAGMVAMDARPHITHAITTRILDSENKMESLEPEAVQNSENEK